MQAPADLAINHVGVTVPDIYAAIDWYGPTRAVDPTHTRAASRAWR